MSSSRMARFARQLLLWCVRVGLLVPSLATAIPPPPARPELVLDLRSDGGARVIEDEVGRIRRCPCPSRQCRGQLLVSLVDRERLLVLDVEAPSRSALGFRCGARAGWPSL